MKHSLCYFRPTKEILWFLRHRNCQNIFVCRFRFYPIKYLINEVEIGGAFPNRTYCTNLKIVRPVPKMKGSYCITFPIIHDVLKTRRGRKGMLCIEVIFSNTFKSFSKI